MSQRTADRKALTFGLLGLASGLVAWALGEALLALTTPLAPPTVPSDPRPIPERSAAPALAPAPAPLPEFATRLERAGAKSGDVQISLIWDDANDLDLHCAGPDGHELYSATRDSPSPTGGRVDVDANTACFGSDRGPPPVENIFWPADTAPPGVYRVYVNGYEQCPTGPDVSRFRVSVAADGKRQEFEGSIAFPERKGKQLVHQFELRPRADAGSAASERTPTDPSGARRPGPLVRGCWAALVAGGLVLAIVIGRSYCAGKRPLVSRASGVTVAGVGAAGLLIGGAGGAFDQLVQTSGGPGVGFVLGWVLLGGLLGAGVNLPTVRAELERAALVGVAGALVGAGAFFAGRFGGEWVGRLLAVVALALGTGLAAVKRGAPARVLPPPLPPPVSVAPVATPPLPTTKPTVPAVEPRPRFPSTAATKPTPKPAATGSGCPGCARVNPGPPGARYCMVCDRTY